ncbi:hypothetical protein [Ruegeria sp. HKCCD8929]|uniref:hypothetical protein n=1 Tax=Ruegeria sp. HKCCD8929 TaxID=2683006 RepID=UPI001488B58F|nr:hypothetical protein [Ruegeria sp. HKCCD8929]
MNRMLLPAIVLSGPAMAHSDTHVHAHGTDYATLGLGLAVIVLVASVLISKLPK